MTRTMMRVAAIGVALLLTARSAAAVDITPYVWQFPVVTGANNASTAEMVAQLQEEVQKILHAGPLAPMRAYYGDIATAEEYFLYVEPGRIVTTLAWAFPYITPAQQTAVRSYVAAELSSASHAPWANSPLSATTGARRELHPLDRVTYRQNTHGAGKPSVHTIYGLWLYAYRTTDWSLIQGHWTTIKSMYNNRSSQGDIYGTMGAHVAMARLAERFADAAMRTTALDNLQSQLDAGVNFTTIEGRVTSKYWGEMYTSRRTGGVYHGWMFLNLAPEVGRYLRDHVQSATLTRHNSGKAKYPLWWLRQAPYFNRWTGDESVGIPTEMMGMIMPIERWVAQASAGTLRDYMRSGPTSVGDAYWLESLVLAIESTGTLAWTDVRVTTPAPAAPTNLRVVQ